ncbi:glycosyltransferase [Gayadomonas joobiniege]|uniref:glycosyltransferase n=1 Tax=Gayadomonas joobiniege TaxID=1234606 RepID=UPI0003717D5B|nr:glycosyltransferase [Gayadomonas joobiniege]
MKLLVMLNRDILSQSNGRAAVLIGFLRVFEKLGYTVNLVVLDSIDSRDKYNEAFSNIRQITSLPSSFSALLFGAFNAFFKAQSLNYNLFYRTSTMQALKKQVEQTQYDYVFVDTVRLFKYVEGLNLINTKVVLDLDDLYSKRYELLQKSQSNYSLLGEFSERFPNFILPLFERLGKLILSREAKYLKQDEINVATQADHVFLVSKFESEYLTKQINKPVYDFPMLIPATQQRWQAPSAVNGQTKALKLVMVGSPKLQQNYITIKNADRLLNKGILGQSELHVIGNIKGFDTSQFSSKIKFLGFVDDLNAKVCEFDCYFSPIVSGTGIKTKNVEASILGMPILTTEVGVEGTNLEKYCYVQKSWDDFEFTNFLEIYLSQHKQKQQMQIDYVNQNFTLDALLCKWKLATEIN